MQNKVDRLAPTLLNTDKISTDKISTDKISTDKISTEKRENQYKFFLKITVSLKPPSKTKI